MKTSKLSKLLIKATNRAEELGDQKLIEMLDQILELHNELDASVYEMALAMQDYNRKR